MKRKLLITLVTIIAVMSLIIAANWQFISLFVSGPYMGGVTESWETSNQGFKLRIDRHSEENAFLGGAYYVFQSASTDTDNWHEIFTARHDDPNPIPRENLQFVNPQIGYVFFGPKYAVTTDGGRSWVVWDAWEANKIWQFEKYKLYPSIEAVSVGSDGRGKMRLFSITDKAVNQPELRTTDYGRSWDLN